MRLLFSIFVCCFFPSPLRRIYCAAVARALAARFACGAECRHFHGAAAFIFIDIAGVFFVTPLPASFEARCLLCHFSLLLC